MRLSDRVGRSLFVALAVGLGWGIRGDFGHLLGAMYPGAALALGFAYVSGQRSLFLWMPVLAALAALGIGSGGTMSYGILHGYAQADSPLNYAYGFTTLFLQGSAWGTFGCGLMGLMLERKPMRNGDWLALAGTILFSGWFVSYFVVDVIGFHINPPRNDTSIAFMGAALGQLIWLAWSRKTLGLRGALLGYVGFGLGMAAGRLLGNLANVMQSPWGFTINHWNVMETSCGFIGGFIFCFGMVDVAYPEPTEEESLPLVSFYSILFVLGVIPLWHRLSRLAPEKKLSEWSKALAAQGVADPDATSRLVLSLINGVCVLGFVGAAIWTYLHFKGKQKFAALPVFWLSSSMLLIQNLNALYFWNVRKPDYVNMHNVFWIILGLMAVYAIFARPRPATAPTREDEGSEPSPQAPRWILLGVGGLGLVIFLAGFVNGERTMKTANTRWPSWTWSSGPPPGRDAKPAR